VPSAPSIVPSVPTPPMVSQTQGGISRDAPLKQVMFVEFFAGDALLTRTFEKAGIRCREPDDLATGGTDFASAAQVRKVREELRNLRTDEDLCLMLHFATVCATFSRARDRSEATRLRSAEFPAGLPDLSPEKQKEVDCANLCAKHTWESAEWAAKELRAIVTLENPKESYIWLFFATLRASAKQLWEDVILSQCCFGTTYRKAFVASNASGSHWFVLLFVFPSRVGVRKQSVSVRTRRVGNHPRTPLFDAGISQPAIGLAVAFVGMGP
jgi:hypothetical protein